MWLIIERNQKSNIQRQVTWASSVITVNAAFSTKVTGVTRVEWDETNVVTSLNVLSTLSNLQTQFLAKPNLHYNFTLYQMAASQF